MAKKKIANIELKDAIVNGMLEKKANDIVILDLRSLQTSMADYFVICHGNSDKQVNAIADSVEDMVRKQTGEKPWHIEGAELGEWILIDYFDIVVHIFKDEKRAFYGIEELWSDAIVTRVDDEPKETSKATAKAAPKAKAKAKAKRSVKKS